MGTLCVCRRRARTRSRLQKRNSRPSPSAAASFSEMAVRRVIARFSLAGKRFFLSTKVVAVVLWKPTSGDSTLIAPLRPSRSLFVVFRGAQWGFPDEWPRGALFYPFHLRG